MQTYFFRGFTRTADCRTVFTSPVDGAEYIGECSTIAPHRLPLTSPAPRPHVRGVLVDNSAPREQQSWREEYGAAGPRRKSCKARDASTAGHRIPSPAPRGKKRTFCQCELCRLEGAAASVKARCRGCGWDSSTVDDLCQDACAAVLEGVKPSTAAKRAVDAERYRRAAEAAAFSEDVERGLSADISRADRREVCRGLSVLFAPDADEDAARIADLVSSLPPVLVSTLWAVACEGSTRAAASLLGVSEACARKRLTQARRLISAQ